MTGQSEISSRSRRAANVEAKRRRIVEAALDVFGDKGFAAARMEDVAAQAGVAKGTIYLYFPSKEALFEGILESVLLPVVEDLAGTAAAPSEPTREVIERMLVGALTRLREGRGRDILRLLIAEGPRFPRLAEIYFERVVSVGLGAIRGLAGTAGEGSDEVARFPHLLFAPILLATIWESLFARLQPLDAEALVRAQVALAFPPGEGGRHPTVIQPS